MRLQTAPTGSCAKHQITEIFIETSFSLWRIPRKLKFAVQGEVPFIELTLFYIELTLTTQLYRKPVSRQQEGADSSENFFTDG